ncbi:Retrovirus-related Pol polyprotein from transposon opus, partial [Cucumispora dikerogammari]
KHFSVLDLKDGFWQVMLRKEDREKTAFLDSNNKLYQFKRMPRGLKNSPSFFQRGMCVVLDGLIGKTCFVYIDDILVFERESEEHNKNLSEVKKRLATYGLKIDDKKSVIDREKVDFLGYSISENNVSFTLNSSEAILDIKHQPISVKLDASSGMTNYDRSFIPELSELDKPLYNIIEAIVYNWTDKENTAFIKIKEHWKYKLKIFLPNRTDTFTLETDASGVEL